MKGSKSKVKYKKVNIFVGVFHSKNELLFRNKFSTKYKKTMSLDLFARKTFFPHNRQHSLVAYLLERYSRSSVMQWWCEHRRNTQKRVVNYKAAKEKIEKELNERMRVKESKLETGGQVLLRNVETGKATPFYDPQPYRVFDIHRRMVTVERERGVKSTSHKPYVNVRFEKSKDKETLNQEGIDEAEKAVDGRSE